MEVKIFETKEQMGIYAADIIENVMKSKEYPVLGLATGDTPITTYNELIKRYKNGEISFKNVKTYNLDEYVGLPKNDKNSYYTFMHEHLFDKVDIDSENIHIPDGNPADIEKFCREYDREIDDAGGIDIQFLGIGRNGHIGFNEPSDKFTEGTYKVKLTESTIEANKRFFEKESDVPKYAVTMGIKNIMKAREIILMAYGFNKAEAVKNMIEGPVSPSCPASILQNHPNVHVILDKDASSLLKK